MSDRLTRRNEYGDAVLCDRLQGIGIVLNDDVERVALYEDEREMQMIARPIDEWGEDYGDVIWWKFPIEEPPYIGSPLCEDWTGYHTHWTPIVCPEPPKGE